VEGEGEELSSRITMMNENDAFGLVPGTVGTTNHSGASSVAASGLLLDATL
jgi:hypothetical protein